MNEEKQSEKLLDLNINLDTTPIVYTDNIFMNANEDGLVLDIGQKLFNTNKVRVVSRIGMSRSHAKKFIKEMGKLLAITDGASQSGTRKN